MAKQVLVLWLNESSKSTRTSPSDSTVILVFRMEILTELPKRGHQIMVGYGNVLLSFKLHHYSPDVTIRQADHNYF